MLLPADPSLNDLQVFWEAQYWDKSRAGWKMAAKFYEDFKTYFGPERKPRDIFRSDVAEWKEWLRKKGKSNTWINGLFTWGSRFYRYLNDRELVEKDFNPFLGMAPRRIRLK